MMFSQMFNLRRKLRFLPLALLTSIYVGLANADVNLPIVPGANPDLFGMTTVAGSGRNSVPPSTTVCKVVNLSDDGTGVDTDVADGVVSGDFRYCVENAASPKTVVFEVGGTIKLSGDVLVSSFTTIAGQTAPNPGVTLIDAGLVVHQGNSDILIQHLRIRPGDRLLLNRLSDGWTKITESVYKHSALTYGSPAAVHYNWSKLVENKGALQAVGQNEWDFSNNTLYVNVGEDPAVGRLIYAPLKHEIPKAIRISDAAPSPEKIVIDHCSLTASADMNVNIGGNYITIMNSIVSDALGNPLHPKGRHSKGLFVNAYKSGDTGGQYVAIINNLISHQDDRNPEISAGYVVVANNYIYDTWQALETYDDSGNRGKVLASFVANYIQETNRTTAAPYIIAGSSESLSKPHSTSKIFLGNDNFWSGAIQDDPWSSESSTTFNHRADLGDSSSDVPLENRANEPSEAVWPGTFSAMSAVEAKTFVLARAGARPASRDSLDAATIDAATRGNTQGSPIYECVSCANNDCVSAGAPWQCCTGTNSGSCPDLEITQLETTSRELALPGNPMELNSRGYTILEEWLHNFAEIVEAGPLTAPNLRFAE